MKIKYRKILKNKKAHDFLAEIKDNKLDFSVREGSECYEIIIDDTLYIFASTESFPQNKLYLFRTVGLQAKKWLIKNTPIIPKENRQQHYNYDFNENLTLAGTDLNHAYWRIAYLKGIITEKTYISGLDDDCKQLRLASISVLGRHKIFDYYENGKKIRKEVLQNEIPELKNIFKMIRNTCWHYMSEVSELLGDDFFSWKTDCIYYANSPENIKKVQNYFDEKKLTYKQLAY